MISLAEFLWGWLLGSAMIGLAMGWVAPVHRARRPSPALFRVAVFVIACAVAIALSRVVPGRFGYALDLGLVMLLLYLIGCAIGSWLRGLLMSRSMTP